MNEDWETLAKRLIAAMAVGVRIEQDSGHRWILIDENADFVPACLACGLHQTKQYGSYTAALDHIDQTLVMHGERTLLERFNDINHYDDLGVVFGTGVQ